MENGATFKLNGVADLHKTLTELGVEVSTKVAATAAREGAKIVRDALIEAAPVGTEPTAKTYTTRGGQTATRDYGRLKDNIRIRKLRAAGAHAVRFGIGIGSAFWGAFDEFGTVHQSARPWLRPAFDRVAAAVVAATADNLKVGIDRQVKRLARLARKTDVLKG